MTNRTNPLDTRCTIKTQEKSTSAPNRGPGEGHLQPASAAAVLSQFNPCDEEANRHGMNALQPKYLHFQDFRTIRTSKSGLMSNILNTLRKMQGEGEYTNSVDPESQGKEKRPAEIPPAALETLPAAIAT
jgi:hypothetical protein